TVNNPGVMDAFIVKYDASGNELWATSGGGGTNMFEMPLWTTIDASGNMYVTGTFSSPTIVFGSYMLTNTGSDDIFIVQYDPSGNVNWAISVGGNNSDICNSVATDNYGNAYFTGW